MKTVRMQPGAAERRDRLLSQGPHGSCLGCERELDQGEDVTIGQCESCYRAQLKAEKAGTKTRRQTIAEGKALPNDTPGRKPASKYARELAEASKK